MLADQSSLRRDKPGGGEKRMEGGDASRSVIAPPGQARRWRINVLHNRAR